MELYDETKEGLKGLWDDESKRQNAKIVITRAIGTASDLSVKTTLEILEELDRELLADKEEVIPQKNRGL